MGQNVISANYEISKEQQLKSELRSEGFSFSIINYAFWKAQKNKISVIFYKSGKLVIQGADVEKFAARFITVDENIKKLEHISNLTSWIGTDEAGKGDFFGPLVVGALYVEKKQQKDLLLMGVQDSKSISDKKIPDVASRIKSTFPSETICFDPQNYNDIYQKYGNLNRLLSSVHAEIIRQMLKKVSCNVVLVDKFGNENLIADELQKMGINISLIQKTKAEANPAVAGASILARAEYLKKLSGLSVKYNMELPKGATHVIQAGKQFVKKYGINSLTHVAKMHFKTVQKIYD